MESYFKIFSSNVKELLSVLKYLIQQCIIGPEIHTHSFLQCNNEATHTRSTNVTMNYVPDCHPPLSTIPIIGNNWDVTVMHFT